MVLVPDAPLDQSGGGGESTLGDLNEGISDSFDNIDSLLDGDSSKSSAVHERWRSTDTPADQTFATDPGAAEHPPADVGSGVATAAKASTLLLRKYSLVACAVIFGAATAIGVIVISADRRDDDLDHDSDVVAASDYKPSASPIEDADDSPTDEQSNPLVDSTADDDSHDPTVSDASPESSPLVDASADDNRDAEVGRTANDLPPDNDVAVASQAADDLANADPTASIDNSEVSLFGDSGLGADDELTGFVEWLKQDPRPRPADNAPVESATPTTELDIANAIEPIVSTNRPEPPLVNVDVRLRDSVDAISFKKAPLVRVLRTIEGLSTIPISVEPDALFFSKLTAKSPVSVLKNKKTIGELLSAVLKSVSNEKLTTEVGEGHISVTYRSLSKYVSQPHKISDMVTAAQDAEELAAWIPYLIAPGTWQADGGRGVCIVDVDNLKLSVTHNGLTHFRVYRFLHRLRAARGLPHKELSNNQSSLIPRARRDVILDETVTVRFPGGGTLSQIATELERHANVSILIDWRSLHTSGWSPRDELPFFCDNVTLRGALEQLLTPIGLAANIVDDSTLQIVNPLDDPSWDIEFYKLPPSQDENMAGDAVAEIATATGIAATSVWDKTSKRLIVAAPQSIHRRLLKVLE